MEQRPILSIIVPVYRAEAYLPACIDALAAQTRGDFEAIFVDDGSPDGSAAILEQAAKADPRIRVIRKENGGVSTARNAGIEAAQGKYLAFVDSDDLITPDFNSRMVDAAETYGADLVLCGYTRFRGTWEQDHEPMQDPITVLERVEDLLLFYTEPRTNLFAVSVWGKLYRADLIRAHNVRFDPAISYEEDNNFNADYFAHIRKTAVIKDCMYRYRQQEESLSKGYRADTFRFLVHGLHRRRELLASHGMERYLPKADAIFMLVIKNTAMKIIRSDLSREDKLREFGILMDFPDVQRVAEAFADTKDGLNRSIMRAVRAENPEALYAVTQKQLQKERRNEQKKKAAESKPKKVGILTFHFAFNCGAALQCYALQRTLEEMGNDVHVINYRPWYHQNRYTSRKNPFYFAKKKWKEPAKNRFVKLQNAIKGFSDTVRSWKNTKALRPREEKFLAFQKRYLKETRVFRTSEALRAHPPKYDLYVAGSDQLWNRKLTDNRYDRAYFLRFGGKDVKRVTYAVGTYFDKVLEEQRQMDPLIWAMDVVSLREEKWLPTVMRSTLPEKPFHVDIDPTLLMDAADYEPLLPKEPPETEPYILIYTMPGEAQDRANRAAKRLSDATGLKMIDVNGNPNNGNRQIPDQRVVGPTEFLWYVKHADYVVTNSFHGTVFSVLYEKKFVTILHAETGNRVSELLERLGLGERYTTFATDVLLKIDEPIDWEGARAKLRPLREESLKYLRYCCGKGEKPKLVTPREVPVLPMEAYAPDVWGTSPARNAYPRPQTREKGTAMYPDDRNAQVVLALLKKYNVRKIVISPGTTNVPISRTVQTDPFFEVYSMVDERGAAYFAGGLAFATGEPVAISCTGATASRDYIPGLTEAYYRGLPVIAITSQHHSPCYTDLMPQMTDRTVSQNDIKRFSAVLPLIKNDEDFYTCVQLVNKALYYATTPGGGPVHINLPVGNLYSFKTPKLPDVQKIDVFDAENFPADALKEELKQKKVALFIGAHKPFDADTRAAIERFVERHDAAVFCDHTANYTGKNRVLSAVAGDLHEIKNFPNLIIDMGSVSGDYSASPIFKGKRVWRISEDREYHNRHGEELVEKLFFCSERYFFTQLKDFEGGTPYYSTLQQNAEDAKTPLLPLSNIYVASQLAAKLPKDSFLHLGILNSLRSMNYFPVDPSVRVSSNVGGFGIDGAISTALGQSKADPNRLSFCLLGDLAFFYDMNALGNRHVGPNLRILLINNGRGVEFRLNTGLENQWGADTDELISAVGHFGSAKAWAESMGFAYMSADTKEAFDANVDAFCDADVNAFEKPVVFEVFTEVFNEQQALKNLRSFNRDLKK